MDQFDLEQLNEVFDGSVENYEVVDLMPKAKTPQMFLLKGEGIDNLVVRLMAQKEGDTLRNLTPSDKNVIVFIMTLNDKGNLGELKGGLGGNPIRALVSIFDTVYKAINVSIVQSIMFRFPAKKMAGQERSVRRILERLLVVRGKNRFVSLPEMANYSSKYSYVVAHKKNLDISDLPGAKNVSERFTKVETAVGETFVDTKSGKQVTKGEVVADAMFTSTNKVDNKQVIAKSKISRRAAIDSQYSSSMYKVSSTYSDKSKEAYLKLTDAPPVFAGSEPNADVTTKITKYNLERHDDIYNELNVGNLGRYIDDFAPESKESILSKVTSIISNTNQTNSYSSIKELIEALKGEPKLSQSVEFTKLLRSAISSMTKTFASSLTRVDTSQYSASQSWAITKYTDDGYYDTNRFLLGDADVSRGSSVYTQQIPDLDSAFEDGVTLTKLSTVYRGHNMTSAELNHAIDTKTFYFKNFVSTSMSPIIFGGPFGTVTDSITSSVETVDNDTETYKCGFVISGLEKIKVIVPGELSANTREAEVILPRGLVLKINEVFIGKSTALIEATIVPTNQIDESFMDPVINDQEQPVSGVFAKLYNSPRAFSEYMPNDLLALVESTTLPEKFVL